MTRENALEKKFNLIKLIEFRETNSVIAVFALHIVVLECFMFIKAFCRFVYDFEKRGYIRT